MSNQSPAAVKYLLKASQISDGLFIWQLLNVILDGTDIEILFVFIFTAFQNLDGFVQDHEISSM